MLSEPNHRRPKVLICINDLTHADLAKGLGLTAFQLTVYSK